MAVGGGGSASSMLPPVAADIYTISADIFRESTAKLNAAEVSKDQATAIFVNELTPQLERLFKKVCDVFEMKSGKAGLKPGLGTYFRTICDNIGSGSGSGNNVFDKSMVDSMSKLSRHRNDSSHDGATWPSATIRNHALTCSTILAVLEKACPL